MLKKGGDGGEASPKALNQSVGVLKKPCVSGSKVRKKGEDNRGRSPTPA